MIPIHLKIKGLYSYREQVEIDFEKLSEQHLFGIFGAVGSGKSAILEAITFALYGKTERLNLSGDNRNYNMMNLQSQELFIELEFKTMVQGNVERYIFRVKQTRNSKEFGVVKAAIRTALHFKNNDWEPLPSTDASEILNLSYDNFIKTIIIPQGKFQDFLHMGATDRTRMLREIFALDRFELSLQTGLLAKETNAQLDILKGQLMTLEESSAELIVGKQAESEAIEAFLTQAKVLEQQLQLAATQHRQLKELSEKIAAAQQDLQKLEGQKAPMAERANRLTQYQKVRLDFSELLSQTERLMRDWKQANAAFTQAQTSVASLEPELIIAQKDAAQAKINSEQRPQIEAQVRDCSHWIAIRQADAELAKLEERLKNGLAMTQKAEAVWGANQAAITAADASLLNEKANLLDQAMIGEVKIWFQQKDQLGQQIGQVDGQIIAASDLAGKLLSDLHALATDPASGQATATATIAELQNGLADSKTAIAQMREQRDLLARQGGLENHALALKPGEPCPLCGSEHHPAPYDSGQSAIAIADLTRQLQELELRLAVQEKALQSAQAIAIRLDENAKQRAQLVATMDALQVQLHAHLQAFKWPQYDIAHPEKVEADGKAATETQARIARAEQELAQMRKAAAELQANQKKYEEGRPARGAPSAADRAPRPDPRGHGRASAHGTVAGAPAPPCRPTIRPRSHPKS
jgi:DNA repair protein SbcC/Rad50